MVKAIPLDVHPYASCEFDSESSGGQFPKTIAKKNSAGGTMGKIEHLPYLVPDFDI